MMHVCRAAKGIELAWAICFGSHGARASMGSLAWLDNARGMGIVCRVDAPPTETGYDVAICPGTKLRNYHWRGLLYCANLAAEKMPKCGAGDAGLAPLPNS